VSNIAKWTGVIVGQLVLFSGAAFAHHSFSAEFDADKPVTITGIVTKVDWTNPHVWLYVNVKDAATGRTANWGAEMGPPHGLQRTGWRRDTLKIGEEVTIKGFMSRNGSNRINARNVTLAATGERPGQTLDAASSVGQDENNTGKAQ
jgi:Family of unknown function (DUF6152)